MAKKEKTPLDDAAIETAPKPKNKETANLVFQEWRMERRGGKLERLKMIRGNVKISQETADALNAGADSPDSVNPIMYFLA